MMIQLLRNLTMIHPPQDPTIQHIPLLEYTTGAYLPMQNQTAGTLLAVATLPAWLKGMMSLMLLMITQAVYL